MHVTDHSKFLRDNDERIRQVAAAMCAQRGRPDLVDDAIQEGRIAVLEAIPSFDPLRGRARDYVAGVVRRAVSRLLAKEAGPFALLTDTGEIPEHAGQGRGVDDLVAGLEQVRQAGDERAQLLALIPGALPSRLGQVATLLIEGQATMTEVGESLGVSRRTARGLARRALTRLRAALSGEKPPEPPPRRFVIECWAQGVIDAPAVIA